MSDKKTIVRRANAWLERQTIEWMDLPYFKITFDDSAEDIWLRFRIVPAGKFNWKISEALQKTYIAKWMSKSEAIQKAVRTCNEFYDACDKCSKEWVKPFKVYISKRDKNKTNDFINNQL